MCTWFNFYNLSIKLISKGINYHSICNPIFSYSLLQGVWTPWKMVCRASINLHNTKMILSLILTTKHRPDVIMLDFCKAFDKVSHHSLLHKLRYYGVWGPILQWISLFLRGCTQRVVYNGSINCSRCHQWRTTRDCMFNICKWSPRLHIPHPVIFSLIIIFADYYK